MSYNDKFFKFNSLAFSDQVGALCRVDTRLCLIYGQYQPGESGRMLSGHHPLNQPSQVLKLPGQRGNLLSHLLFHLSLSQNDHFGLIFHVAFQCIHDKVNFSAVIFSHPDANRSVVHLSIT